jgi:predicted DNA-binding transcriptional regulator AlpA
MKSQTTLATRDHAQIRLTHQFKEALTQKVKWLFINREFIELIQVTIEKLPQKDKLAALYYFKKLAVQVLRKPDIDHYNAFKDEYDELLSEIADEQIHFEPVRWISSEIEFITNTTEKLTVADVNQRLDIMQEAKHKLSKDWLTKNDMMDLFNISKSTLNRRVADGMPAHKNGKFIYFYLEEVNEWMKKEAA